MIPDTTKTKRLEKDIQDIAAFPESEFAGIIREVGFECDCCGKCCTSEYNDHVFLMDEDTLRIAENMGMDYLQPAPYYDFCDNLGRFYVMGYALKSKTNGNCIFYTENKCEHYDIRPAICRIYPYMLHREEDKHGNAGFRQVSGLGEHGTYHNELEDTACRDILEHVKKYETAFLKQKIRFLDLIKNHFKTHGLRHKRHMYDKRTRDFEKGGKIEVYVFYNGEFDKNVISKQIINNDDITGY